MPLPGVKITLARRMAAAVTSSATSLLSLLQLLSIAISKNANSAQLYYAKGSVYETGLKDYAQAEEAYKKAVELDPNSAANNFSMGRIYYNQGVSTLDKANSISDATQYKQEKAKAEELFRKALPFFEKARELKPDEKEFLIGLRGIYYNLNMNEKFDEIEAEMNK